MRNILKLMTLPARGGGCRQYAGIGDILITADGGVYLVTFGGNAATDKKQLYLPAVYAIL